MVFKAKKTFCRQLSKILAIRHALIESEKYTKKKFDIIFNLHVTAPLRSANDIKSSLKQFLNEQSNKLISVTPSKRNPYFNMVEIAKKKVKIVKRLKKNVNRRQDSPTVYDMNASIYIWKRKELLNLKLRYDNKTSLYIMPEERSVDIDNNFDWKLAEYILKNKKNEK